MSLISEALQKVQAQWAQRVGKVSFPHYGSILPSAGKDALWTNPTTRRRVAMALAVVVGVPAIAYLLIALMPGSRLTTHPSPNIAAMPPHSMPGRVHDTAGTARAVIAPNNAADTDTPTAATNTSFPTRHSGTPAGMPSFETPTTAARTGRSSGQASHTALPQGTEPSSTVPEDVGTATPAESNGARVKGKPIAVTHQPTDLSPEMKAEALALFRAGVSAQKHGDFARATESYRQSLRIDPSNVAAYNNLGTAYKNTNNMPAAIEAYRKALWLDPTFDEARINLASALFEHGKLDQATEALTTVLTNAPDTLEAHAILGAIYGRSHREDEAIHEFRHALSLNPNLAETHYNLAILLERVGEFAEALTHFQRFVEVSHEHHADVRKTVEGHLGRLQRARAQHDPDVLEP